ncbi:tripartite tricarboxylate transporter substrate binding protein [Pollutimonas bauzanensis]|uniref:Tripartite-type tricarboxylate transporter, receptor component TctC n=1 Tax=Pollutimonas bauzanensis TaxID=658167 RepID=A0A1M5YPW3_9BURK|nr:tripartite tricarboxylate transporter substrate binding protein [Pollutimonas bauzanensis]SHI13918.1 Tripartite-type tricarboxylate transporter, receptor component TctC [Pollutimonas bauzanensis]
MSGFKPLLAKAAVGAALALSAAAAFAWPDRPIELVVGFAPGGGTDITARTLASYLEKELGGSILVINKPGASGAIGLSQVARAKPDGYTLGMTNMPGLLTLPIERQSGFTAQDFTYLATLVRDPSAFSVSLDAPYKTLDDLIADARARPGAISYGSTGVGTDDHLAMVLFEQLTQVDLNHVPFNGAGPLRNAVMGGHAVIGGMNLGEAMPYNGKTLRILGQASEKRSELAPDVPTFKEQGVDLVFASERGVVAPRNLPPEVAKKLMQALDRVAKNPEFQGSMKQQFTEMDYLPGDQWQARLKEADTQFRALWAKQKWVE